MRVEFLANFGERMLADISLDRIDGKLQSPGDNHGRQVEGAICQKQIDLFEPDSLVDDSLLQFQWKHSHKYGHCDYDQKSGLQPYAAGFDPVAERAFCNHHYPLILRLCSAYRGFEIQTLWNMSIGALTVEQGSYIFIESIGYRP